MPAIGKVTTRISAAAIALALSGLAVWEGERLIPYLDSGGVPTVCMGITGPDVRMGKIYTAEECRHLNKKAVNATIRAIERLITVPLPDHTAAAIISWTYNLGEGNLATSTLRRKMNAGDIAGACREIPRWHYVKRKDCRIRANDCYGIIPRRKQEMNMCLEGLR